MLQATRGQKCKYMILGAVIMLMGIGFGLLVSLPLVGQPNGVFDEIRCHRLITVDEKGNEHVVLARGMVIQNPFNEAKIVLNVLKVGAADGYVLIDDSDGKTAIQLISREYENRINISDKNGNRRIALGSHVDDPGYIAIYDEAHKVKWAVPPDEDYEIEIELDPDINSNRVAANPSYSEFLQAFNADDKKLINELARRATPLRANLEFPRNTFAVDSERGIVVAHKSDGRGVLIKGGPGGVVVGGDMNLGWLTFEKRGQLRVLSHYEPNDR